MGVELTSDRVTGVLHVCGEIDISCDAAFMESCRSLMEPDRPVTLDLRDVTFMDSTGVKALIQLAKDRPCPITIVGCRPAVERLLSMMGIDGHLPNLRIVRNRPADPNGHVDGGP